MDWELFKTKILVFSTMILVLLFVAGNIATCATSKRIGAECCDGTTSSATGSGACSDHGGVSRWRMHYWFSDMEEPWKSIGRGFSGLGIKDSQCKD